MRTLIILILLSGCAGKDYNPWTTIVNQLIKEKKQNGYEIKTER